jgi:hypothetical protein
MMTGLQLSRHVAGERNIKVQERAEDSYLLMLGCFDGHALATIWQVSSVFLFRVRHSSKCPKDVGPLPHQHFGVYTTKNIASHLRGIEFLTMRL